MPSAKDGMKICSNPNCVHNGEPQPVSNFNKNKSRKDGLQYYCKDCEHKTGEQYRNSNVDKNKKRHAIYHKNNQKKCNATTLKNMNSPAKYDTWVDRLSPYEECQRDPDNPELLQVKCKNSACQKWFTPTYQEANHRYDSINNVKSGERNFYCSDECKKTCAIYGQKTYLKGLSPRNNDRPGQAEFREMVIDRDGLICEKCGKTKEEYPDLVFVCHHIIPVKVDPIQSADIDNGIILCEDCHNWIHTNLPGCTYAELRKCILKEN